MSPEGIVITIALVMVTLWEIRSRTLAKRRETRILHRITRLRAHAEEVARVVARGNDHGNDQDMAMGSVRGAEPLERNRIP